MRDLVRLCHDAGLEDAKTYIQSGNVVFRSHATEADIKARLRDALTRELGKPVGVRTARELEQVLANNPFPREPPNRVVVLFLDEAPPPGAVADVERGGERLVLHGREIYIHFPHGQGASKLKVPFADVGTGRKVNTVTKLAAMASALAG